MEGLVVCGRGWGGGEAGVGQEEGAALREQSGCMGVVGEGHRVGRGSQDG